MSIPIVNLEDFEEPKRNNFSRTDNSLINSCKFYNVTDKDRVECIKKLLRLEHLNQDEYEHVEKLIKINADRFQIPGEPPEATNVLQHSNPTVDDSPIFLRQYRFPPVHNEEITRQVDELLQNKRIKPSQAPYNTPV